MSFILKFPLGQFEVPHKFALMQCVKQGSSIYYVHEILGSSYTSYPLGWTRTLPVGNYMFKLTIKALEQGVTRCSSVSIVNFKQVNAGSVSVGKIFFFFEEFYVRTK